MMDNGGDEALVFFAIVIFMFMRIIIPSLISLFVVFVIKFFNRNISRKSLLVFWIIFYVIVSFLLSWIFSPNFPTNHEVIIEMPDNLITRIN